MTSILPDSITGDPARIKKKGLLIAVQNNMMKGFDNLNYAQRDAKELKSLLMEFGYLEEHIVLMMDSKSVPEELWPTKKRVREQIERFVRDVSVGDHLFLYYSGHGRQVPCRHHTEPDGLNEVIYTCNRKQIMDNDLNEWLVKRLPHGCKLFALWDSCHSQTILDLDHYNCNEPEIEQQIRRRCDSGYQSLLRRVLPKYLRCRPTGKTSGTPSSRAVTIAHELRGRPITRASVSITAVSAGNSPPVSKWVPFSMDIPRVLSPPSWFKCNGKCPLPTESDAKCAHVISLSACRDDESAFDDAYNGTFTQFFIDHLKEKPDSTLRELLLAIRQRVDEITAARREWDKETGVISRRSTFASDRRIKTEWSPQAIRRSTEVNVSTLEELFQYTPSSARRKYENKYSQRPSYSSHYRLDLDELVDL